MHFKLGKSRIKREQEQIDAGIKDIAAERIEKMEKRIYGRTKDLEEKAQQIQGLAGVADKTGDIPLGPHGPIGELTLEASDKSGNLAALVAVPETDDSEEEVEKVKLVEVSAISAPPPIKAVKVGDSAPAPAKSPEIAKEVKPGADTKKEAKPDDSDSLGNLFNQNEEEINPLANLIDSLPDVTTRELIEDLKEIKRIIKEWQTK